MAYFYSIRGWLEVESDSFNKVIKLLKALQNSYPTDTKEWLYLQGWCWQEKPINWTQYLFYGADVNQEGVQLFETTLNKLIAQEMNLSGYFHAQGEEGEKNFIYKITDDTLKRKVSKILVAVT